MVVVVIRGKKMMIFSKVRKKMKNIKTTIYIHIHIVKKRFCSEKKNAYGKWGGGKKMISRKNIHPFLQLSIFGIRYKYYVYFIET